MRAAQHRVGCTGAQTPVHYVGLLPSVLFIGAAGQFPVSSLWTERDTRWATRQASRTWLRDNDGKEDCEGAVGARALRSGLWRVSSYGASVVRDYADVEPNPASGMTLLANEINGQQPLPVGLVASRVGAPAPLVINVKISDTQARQVQIDAGQTIFVFADDVSVSWSAPGPDVPMPSTNGQGWVDVGGTGAARVPLPFEDPEVLIVEGLLYVDIARVESPRQQGQDYAKLTQYVQAAAPDGRATIPIPPGARRVQITRDPSGVVVAGVWEVGFSDGVNFTAIGAVNSGSAVTPRVGIDQFAAFATHLRSPAIVENHTWTIVWEIAP
jgi:hypothetical protein